MADDEIIYESVYYCSPCDRYFTDIQSRADHIQFSDKHPKCDKCNVRFANKNSLRNHFTLSRRHHYCSMCRIHFRTPAGFRAHVLYASVHRDDSDEEDEDEAVIDYMYDGWEDDIGLVRFPEENDTWLEPSVADDDFVDPEDEYWDEDDEPDPEEAEYRSWGPVAGSVYPEADVSRQLPSSSLESMLGLGTPIHQQPDPLNVADVQVGKDHSSQSSTTLPPPAGTPGSVMVAGCPLCLELANQPCVTWCGHIFCSWCITEALDVQRRCPVCRVPAGPRQLRRIYFSTPVS